MLYSCHFSDLPNQRAFGIVVDDETMTWTSEPPGQEIPAVWTGYFSRQGGGPIGSGKQFEVLPGGKARLVS
jgi:hypothetical protein